MKAYDMLWGHCAGDQWLAESTGLHTTTCVYLFSLAQGMSDVLRCPVCSCAHSLCTLRMRPRVQRASGIPCALCFRRGREILAKLGRTAPRECECVFGIVMSKYKKSSCPGLTRASIPLRKMFFEVMDCRVKPGNDGGRAV